MGDFFLTPCIYHILFDNSQIVFIELFGVIKLVHRKNLNVLFILLFAEKVRSQALI